MERRMSKVILKEGNVIELPKEVLTALKTNVGEELTMIYTEDIVVLMTPEKFGELILKKF